MFKLRERMLYYITGYLLFETVVLGIHYYLMAIGNDILFGFFEETIILLTGIGLCISISLLVVKFRKKIDKIFFFKMPTIFFVGNNLSFYFFILFSIAIALK